MAWEADGADMTVTSFDGLAPILLLMSYDDLEDGNNAFDYRYFPVAALSLN